MLRLLCANCSTDFEHLSQKEKAGGGDGMCADRLRSSLCHASTKMLSEAAKGMMKMSYRKPAKLMELMREDTRSPGDIP